MTPPAAIGHFRIVSKLGEGGMGAVYRATDTKLNRDVAIKVLPEALANDPDYLARFTREAQLLASLNHPNIAIIHGVEDNALVMELVPGQTLEERITAGPLPLEDALSIARQIADALEAAHEKGVIHRDLKPANVKVTPEGVVKVLDFGLAKGPDATGHISSLNSPTLTMHATQAGLIMGTPAYMSPEQAAGKPVDRRADIWSFGVVLYEMLAGKMLFAGDTVSHTLASVLKDPIDLNALNVPSQIWRLLARCLDRNLKTRLRDIGEARIAIDRFLADPSSDAVPASTAPPPSRRAILPWAIAAAVTLAVLVAGGFALTHPRLTIAPAAVRFQSNIFSKLLVPIFELSPDGRFLAYTAVIDNQSGLWVRPLDSLASRALPGTEGATYPIWSPDSASLAFFAQGKLKKIAISGGVVQSLCDAPAGRGGAWGPDGAIVFAPTNASGLFRVSSSGGAPAPLTRIAVAGEYDRYPWFIPGTDRFLYLHATANPQTAGLYMSSLGGMSPVRVLPDLTQAYFVPDAAVGRGWIVFNREGSVVAQPFDPDHARLSADPVLLAGSVGSGGNSNKWSFSASATGVLAVHPDAGDRQQIAWVDRTGRVLSRVTAPARIQSFALSPDEKRLLLRIGHGGGDLWLQDLDGGNLTRLTSSGKVDTTQVWSPDGRYVLYAERPNSLESHLYRKPADGSTREELLADLSHQTSADDWSRDGKYLLIGNSQATAPKLLLFPADYAGRPLSPLPGKSMSGYGGRISPDSRWLAVTTEEGGGHHVFVQAFPNGGPAWQVYSKQADEPHWRRDGKELYIIGADRKVIAIPVETNGNVFRAGTPQSLFEIPSRDASLIRLQPSADGQRFLVRVLPEGEPAVPPLEFVLNWPATVRRSEIAR